MSDPHTDVPCSYGKAKVKDLCVSSGGFVLIDSAHQIRTSASLATRAGQTFAGQEKPRPKEKLSGKLGAALWFIRTAGGVEEARVLFEAAVRALEALPKDQQ